MYGRSTPRIVKTTPIKGTMFWMNTRVNVGRMHPRLSDCPIEEVRTVMSFLWANPKSIAGYLRGVWRTLYESTCVTVYEWVERFKMGKTSVTDESWSGLPPPLQRRARQNTSR